VDIHHDFVPPAISATRNWVSHEFEYFTANSDVTVRNDRAGLREVLWTPALPMYWVAMSA